VPLPEVQQLLADLRREIDAATAFVNAHQGEKTGEAVVLALSQIRATEPDL
jgi:hypothetical protein